MNSQFTPRSVRQGAHVPTHVGAGAVGTTGDKTLAYVSLGGAAVGLLAGALIPSDTASRVLYGGAGLVVGGMAGALGTTLVQKAIAK